MNVTEYSEKFAEHQLRKFVMNGGHWGKEYRY